EPGGRVDGDGGVPADARAERVCGRAEHHDGRRTPRREHADQPVEKGFALVLEQCFRGAHAALLARGENEAGGLHLESTARSDSSANTDIDSERQLEAGVRRTAIISAA